MNDLIFVYGTLLDAENKYGVYLRDNSKFFSSAKLSARLYDLGDYPGVVLHPDGTNKVQGVILQMDDPQTILGVLDIYEGFGIDQPQPNEFVRVLTEAETGLGLTVCWVYVYNLPLDNVQQIRSGNYHE